MGEQVRKKASSLSEAIVATVQQASAETEGRPPRVIFAGGGTGGHLMPGVASAEALCELAPGARCLFLGTGRDAKAPYRRALDGFEVCRIPAARWRGGALQKFRFAAVSVAALGCALEVLTSFRPQVVVGLGGYGCVVPLLAARFLRIPAILFESNAVAGEVVRRLAPLVDCVQLQWAVAARGLRARRFLVKGNPVRARILGVQRERALLRFGFSSRRCTLLALGGSQGALPLNRVLLEALDRLPLPVEKLQVLHLTGKEHLEQARNFPVPQGLGYRAIGYLDEMEDAYAAADFVLSRAGGSTLAELTALGLPSLLVPYPYATEGHQMANARVLTDAGAAICIEESHLSAGLLASLIAELARNPDTLRRMSERARQIGRPAAARAVALEILGLARCTPHADRSGSYPSNSFGHLLHAA